MATSSPAQERALSPAVAPPPGNPRFALFDSLRGIAVLCIIAFHVAGITGAINTGFTGDLYAVLGELAPIFFFIISGFLLYRPFVSAHARGRDGPSIARYARRRVLRIVPGYWTALTVLAIFPGIVGVFSHDWWRYYFFLQPYSNRTVGGGIPSAWSLGVEASFYILLPVWALCARRVAVALKPRSWFATELTMLAALAAVGIGVQVAASRLWVSALLTTTLLGECTWFALGMALATVSVAVAARPAAPLLALWITRRAGLCWIGALVCLIGLTLVLHPGGLFNIIASLRVKQPLGRTLGGITLTAGLSLLLMAPAIFGEQGGGLPQRVLAWRALAGLGLVSYGVFLYHLTVGELIGQKVDPSHFPAHGLGLTTSVHQLTTPILLVLTLALSVLVAAGSYRFVELPFLRRKEG